MKYIGTPNIIAIMTNAIPISGTATPNAIIPKNANSATIIIGIASAAKIAAPIASNKCCIIFMFSPL